jgi:predicted regulator of Ras-like GTPase activity (Roadblock/LC7/MglB family)
MTTDLRATLGELARLPGVRAALVTTEREGLPIDSVTSVGVDADALAAFAMALFRRARLANAAAGHGDTRQLALDAAGGRVFVGARGELVMVVLADRDAGAGLIRMAMQRAARAVA